MWCSKEDKTGPEKHVNRGTRGYNPATYVDSRIVEYFTLTCALTSALVIRRPHQHIYVLWKDAPYLFNKDAAKAVANEDQRSSVVL